MEKASTSVAAPAPLSSGLPGPLSGGVPSHNSKRPPAQGPTCVAAVLYCVCVWLGGWDQPVGGVTEGGLRRRMVRVVIGRDEEEDGEGGDREG